MTETCGERQTGIEKPVDAGPDASGSRTLRAGGDFLSLIGKARRPRPPRRSGATHTSETPATGRILWRLSVVLLAFGTIAAGAVFAVGLWMFFGFHSEPARRDAKALAPQFRTREATLLGGAGPLTVTGTPRQDVAREAGAQRERVTETTVPSNGSSSGASPPALSAGDDGPSLRTASSSAPAESAKPAKEAETKAGLGASQSQLPRTEPQELHLAARQQDVSAPLTNLRPPLQCKVDVCAATYKSFHAADCTYQPESGGPRRVCDVSTRPGSAPPQTARAAADPQPEAQDAPVAERMAELVPKAASPARAGAQCNIDICAAAYRSFHTADCTYQPYDGGPRRVCER